ncbi:NAD(P)H-dependent oxidoreductase [Actinacidiphila glaucinigra]|uniref:NAD(P)H-dependent oxidoreductase n=1 Tax=Actinacidiphila glaucinigra TaxID=235986 RepID=UPI00396A0A46
MITATPVCTAGVSGLFKSFFDVLDDGLVVARPVLLAATAGSPRHALVVEDHVCPMFACPTRSPCRRRSSPPPRTGVRRRWGPHRPGGRRARGADGQRR